MACHVQVKWNRGSTERLSTSRSILLSQTTLKGLMVSTTLPELFHLRRNEELLAVLELCRLGDEMFWLVCDFKPTILFAEVAALFYEASEASEREDVDIFEHNYNQLREMGVFLFEVAHKVRIIYFIIHLEENRVHLSYAEPPYLE